MNLGTARIIQADSRNLPLPDNSVDLICTSPPYFALRSYQDGGEHYANQIGDEPTPTEFVDSLIEVTRECVRVLKPSGSLWLNLGDKYASSGTTPIKRRSDDPESYAQTRGLRTRPSSESFPHKSLMGLPWRYALRCIDDLGLILRAEVIWCLSGGARVYARTATGDRPIMLRDLVRAYRPEDVQLWNGERWTQVLGWNKTPDDDGALELELRTGERVGCTPGHKWPTQRGVIRADEVRVGDVVQTTRLPEPETPRTPALLPDEDIGWLVGLYIAEGSRSETTVQFAGHAKEVARHARLARIAAALDGTCSVYTTSENVATANLRGSVIVGVIDRYVSPGTAKTKHLRAAAWQRSDAFLAAVVDGYLSGDGHYDAKNGRWRLGFTANDEWAADLRTLAARLGAKLSLRRKMHQGFGGEFPGWGGEWRWTRSLHHSAKQDGEVVAIRRSRARDFYDLGVADDPHLFALASGVLTHNSKPNGLPESVTDRVRRSHEVWFHFVQQPRYFSAVDEIREGYEAKPQRRFSPRSTDRAPRQDGQPRTQHVQHYDEPSAGDNPLGKLPGSVWTVPTEPLRVPDHLGVDHFAAFPTEWPRRIIQGWSPAGVCTVCREGRRPVVVTDLGVKERLTPIYSDSGGVNGSARHGKGASTLGSRGSSAAITGYACACGVQIGDAWTPTEASSESDAAPESTIAGGRSAIAAVGGGQSGGNGRTPRTTAPPTTPAVVLDPFGGTGTTAMVAKALGRDGISVDMSADYCRLATWRCNDRDQLAKVLGIEKVEQPHRDDVPLFDLEPIERDRPSGGIGYANAKGRTCPACGYRSQRPSGCEKCGADLGGAA